jgi:glycosyltransferase involved in cell wall biosynthesis
MNNISICIVTFKERSELIKSLIGQIRSHVDESINIVLAVNGNNEEEMPESYRQDMLNLCSSHKNIYPIICPEFKSLCKLWNTLAIFSKTEYIFYLCDDVAYENPNILKEVLDFINVTKSEFFTINNQFSHFVLTKSVLHKLGYFDERLAGFGEEDGDIIHRYIEIFGERMPNLHINGLYNKASYELKNKKIETHIDNKPRFNREFASLKYKQDPSGICGMSPVPIIKVIDDYQQYPYENFVKNNKHNISKFQKIILDEEI